MILFYYQELMCPKNCRLSTDPYHVATEGTWFLEGGAAAGGTGTRSRAAAPESCEASLTHVQTSAQTSADSLSPEGHFKTST